MARERGLDQEYPLPIVASHECDRRLEEGDQADGPISTGKLNVLPRLHRRPINLVVYQGTRWDD